MVFDGGYMKKLSPGNANLWKQPGPGRRKTSSEAGLFWVYIAAYLEDMPSRQVRISSSAADRERLSSMYAFL